MAALRPGRRANTVADVAYNPVEIKARLVGVSVYTVANKKNEFVLVSGIAEVSWAPHGLWGCPVSRTLLLYVLKLKNSRHLHR